MYIKTFENFLGQNNQNKKKQRKLLYAKELEKRGKSLETIRLLTGWFKNRNDNEWRFENSSYPLQFKTILYDSKLFTHWDFRIIKMDLKDLLVNTSLFKDYPELATIKMQIDKMGNSGHGGYDPERKLIFIDGVPNNYHKLIRDKESMEVYKNSMTDEYLDTLPKFSRSGKPINKEEKRAEYEDHYIKYRDSYNQLSSKSIFEFDAVHKGVLIHEIQHAIQYIENLPVGSSPLRHEDDYIYDDETDDYVEVSAFQQYLNNAGEIEAREAQDRISLNTTDTYIVYDSRYWDSGSDKGIGFVTSFATREEAEHFINSNKIVKKDNGESIGTKYLAIDKKDGYKTKTPLKNNQGVNPKHVTKRYQQLNKDDSKQDGLFN